MVERHDGAIAIITDSNQVYTLLYKYLVNDGGNEGVEFQGILIANFVLFHFMIGLCYNIHESFAADL